MPARGFRPGIVLREELDRAILAQLEGAPRQVFEIMAHDPLILAWQNQANHVSIVRLGYNDHGPVHMRIVALNSLRILSLLHEAGVKSSLEFEGQGSIDDSRTALVMAAMLHDVGMGITRERHEWHSIVIGMPRAREILATVYPDNLPAQLAVASIVQEAIVGHMGHDRIHSIEAGILLVADGTDMTKGRARIAKKLAQKPVPGDMHRHSADAIKEVNIQRGGERPVHISIRMDDYSGIFQVEEVLLQKIGASPIQRFIELSVIVRDDPPRRYL